MTEKGKRKFAPLCPEFIVELKSDTDDLKDLREKMLMWLSNGCQLAWLIDPDEEQCWVYCSNIAPKRITGFDQSLSGENILPNFTLNLSLLNE